MCYETSSKICKNLIKCEICSELINEWYHSSIDSSITCLKCHLKCKICESEIDETWCLHCAYYKTKCIYTDPFLYRKAVIEGNEYWIEIRGDNKKFYFDTKIREKIRKTSEEDMKYIRLIQEKDRKNISPKK